ncbi:fimbria/pilus outer membrane usher protein, partial [Klebsiella pneumoniae]
TFKSNADGLASPTFISSTLAYGLTSNLSGIVGLQASDDYSALSIGAGKNTAFGAFSLDTTHSSSKARGQT